jgi:predicted nucleic acid-binding protein
VTPSLVDTSVWIRHLRYSDPALVELLRYRQVFTHSCVIGELACGSLHRREPFLSDLNQLPKAKELEFGEVLAFISGRALFAKGLGWVDMQVLASALVSGISLFTYDKRLSDLFAKLSNR